MNKNLLLISILSAFSISAQAANTFDTLTIDGNKSSITSGIDELNIDETGAIKFSNQNGHAFTSNGKKGTSTAYINGKSIDFESTARGMVIYDGAEIKLGSTSTESINIQAGDGGIMVIRSDKTLNPAKLTITTNTLNVISTGEFGIHVQNGTEDGATPADTTHIIINAQNTYVKSNHLGLSAFSHGQIDVNGNLTVDAINAIDARGNSTININQKGDGVITLNGDIVFETPNTPEDTQNSGKIINSNVNINLTEGSSWTGKSYQEYKVDNEYIQKVELNTDPYYGNVTGFTLSISNGAEWNMNGDSFINTLKVENGGLISVHEDVTTFNADAVTLNDAVIDVQGNANININTLTGTGGDITLAAETDGETLTTGKISVRDDVAETTVLNVMAAGIDADDITNSESAMASLREAVETTGGTVNTVINEGDVKGRLYDNGSGVLQDVNTKLSSLSSITAITTVQWRHEMNDLTKRMGELRDSPAGIGSWVRLYGSEQEYGKQNVKQKSTSVQVGADYAIGDWVVGGAFSYTDGSTDYANGTGDTKAYGIAAYGTWMAENGLFLDLIAKYSRLENDFEISNMKGSLDNNAYSLSAELGWHFDVNDLVYVEPQAELTYGRIIGDDTTTSNGVRVEQDDYNALLGRIGLRAGLKFPENRGSVYARLSGVYDFDAESSATYSKGGQVEHLKEDLGGGWVEYAVGANFNLTPATYTYVDLERASGGEVKENWRWNVGLRHVF